MLKQRRVSFVDGLRIRIDEENYFFFVATDFAIVVLVAVVFVDVGRVAGRYF